MKDKKKTIGLILPADTPPRRSSLKRQLLFFDSVLLPSDEDIALINEHEISERFPNGMLVQWSLRTPFPKSQDYAEIVRDIKTETEFLQKQGLIKFLPVLTPNIDPGANWFIYHNAISNPSIVQAAVPEADSNPPSILPSNGVYNGGAISASGYKSRYDLDAKPVYNLSDVYPQWNAIAHARVARALKFIRRAYGESACPVALDPPNAALCSSLISNSIGPENEDALVAQNAISLDVVDPLLLDKELKSMNWNDVLQLRRVILPNIANLRQELFKRAIKLCRIQGGNLSVYRKVLLDMDSELKRHQDELSKAWAGLRIKGILTAGSTVGLFGLGQVLPGLNMLLSPQSIYQLILGVVSAGLVSAAPLSGEIKEYIICRKKVINHPLFFIEKLPSEIIKK